MNKIKIAVLSLFLALALAFGVTAEAQTALTNTTFAAAVTASATQVRVASATGIVAGNLLFIEDGTGAGLGSSESMFVESVSGTVLTVVRGYYGSIANPHILGALVITGTPSQFYAVDPSGACTPTAQPVTPYINVKTGNQWLCSSITNSWVPGFFNTAAQTGLTAAVASATTMVPSGPIFHVTGSTAITTIGSGVGMGGTATSVIGASFCIIPDNATAAGLTAGNNIALSTTFVVSKPVCLTFDQTNKKYVPTY
jgi:hypothetical protein